MKATRPLRLGEMARSLGVKTNWLRAECEAGRLPHIRAGDAYLFDRETVIRVLAKRAAAGGADAEGGEK